MAVQPWRTGSVIKIINETPDTRRFWIQIPDVESFDFTPGQFVTLDLPIHDKPAKRMRSYSIASPPDGTNVIELVIVLDHRGTGTPYLFNHVGEGSALTLRGPQGTFTLHEPLDKDLFLVCTGTGIAPFRSMVHHIQSHGTPHGNIYLIFGCRSQSTLLYYDEMRALEKELPGFHYIPTLSREHWTGRCGYVHPIYEELCAAHQPADFYLCGWKHMLTEAKARILAMGYDKSAIHQEIYG